MSNNQHEVRKDGDEWCVCLESEKLECFSSEDEARARMQELKAHSCYQLDSGHYVFDVVR